MGMSQLHEDEELEHEVAQELEDGALDLVGLSAKRRLENIDRQQQ